VRLRAEKAGSGECSWLSPLGLKAGQRLPRLVRHWSTLGVPPPRADASEIERLRFIRNLSIRSLLSFGPITVAPFVVFAVPLWGFGVLAAVFLLQALSIMRLTQRIRRAGRTQ
jgi:hypothetical protein